MELSVKKVHKALHIHQFGVYMVRIYHLVSRSPLECWIEGRISILMILLLLFSVDWLENLLKLYFFSPWDYHMWWVVVCNDSIGAELPGKYLAYFGFVGDLSLGICLLNNAHKAVQEFSDYVNLVGDCIPKIHSFYYQSVGSPPSIVHHHYHHHHPLS